MDWNNQYSIGVDKIDKQHQGLFVITKRFFQIIAHNDPNRNRRACPEAMKFLKNYTLQHFSDEEEYMRSIGYRKYDQHKVLHQQFLQTVLTMEKEMIAADYSSASVEKLAIVLSAWLAHHIMKHDQAITHNLPPIRLPDSTLTPEIILQRVVNQEGKFLFGEGDISCTDQSPQATYTEHHRLLVANCKTACGHALRTVIAMDPNLARNLAMHMLGEFFVDVEDVAYATVDNIFAQIFTGFVENLYLGQNCQIEQILHITTEEFPSYIPDFAPACSLRFYTDMGAFNMGCWTLG